MRCTGAALTGRAPPSSIPQDSADGPPSFALWKGGVGGGRVIRRTGEGEGKERNCSRPLVCMEDTQKRVFRLKKACLTRCSYLTAVS
jgi:hypothetical protein